MTYGIECLCAGTLVVDLRTTESLESKPSGALNLLDTCPRFATGGISITAQRLVELGHQAVLAGCLGRDILGGGFRSQMNDIGVGLDFVKDIDEPTSFSYIHLLPNQRRISHFLGANAYFGRSVDLPEILKTVYPKVLHFGYLGLLPDMEADSGRRTLEGLHAARKMGTITVLDIHTRPSVVEFLPAVLAEVDVFFCNAEEAVILSGKENCVEEELLGTLWEMAGQPKGIRMFGITGATSAHAFYNSTVDREPKYSEITNPYYGRIEIHDLTGAGDSFRAGLIGHILSNGNEWTQENMKRAMLAAHACAARAIS